MLLNFLRIFGFYCLLHSVLIVILPTLQLFADKLWQHCVIKYKLTTAELKIHLVALCIRLWRCDGNLYWLQMMSKCRSAEEEGEKKVQTKSRYYSARIPYNTHWQPFHTGVLYLVCWFLNLSEWKILITPYYSKLFNTQMASINTKPHKSLFSFFVYFFFIYYFFFPFLSRLNYLVFCHLTSFIQIGKGALFSFFSMDVWAVVWLTMHDKWFFFQSISDFLSLSAIVFQ